METRKHGGIRKVRSSEFLHTTSGFSENGQKPWIPVWESASHIFAPFAYFTLFSSCGGHLHSNRTSFILPYFHEKEILEYKTNAFWYVCIIIKLLRFIKWRIPWKSWFQSKWCVLEKLRASPHHPNKARINPLLVGWQLHCNQADENWLHKVAPGPIKVASTLLVVPF